MREYFIYFINETQVYMGLNMYPSGIYVSKDVKEAVLFGSAQKR